MLAFWIGGACGWTFVPVPIPPQPPIAPGGLPRASHLPRRVIRDDEEVLDFLRIWVTWDNIEGP